MTKPATDRVALLFLERFWAAQDEGECLPLAAFLEQFPGHDETIAREYVNALKELEDGENADEESEAEQLGPYHLIRELGRGGQGVVWLAEDTRLGRQVALKILTGLGPGAETHLARFKREAALASKIEHPGICSVHDTGIEGGIPFIAMRFVDGETLGERLSRLHSTAIENEASAFMSFEDDAKEGDKDKKAISSSSSMDRHELNKTIAIFENVSLAMHAAHEVGVIHRDIKPGNIMLTERDEPIILDFGLAHDSSDDAGPSLTQTGDLFGTPAYMSPEQITGRRVVLDRRSDVFSLGVTLYECITGQRPFASPTRESLYQAILSKDPLPARKLNRSIPADLETVLQAAMEKDRDKRYQTAADFAEDLRRVLSGEPILAKKVSVFGRTWRWAVRRPAAAVLIVVIILSLPTISALSVWYLNNKENVDAQILAKKQEQVESHVETGFYCLHKDDTDAANMAFSSALEIDGLSIEAITGLILSWLEDESPQEALDFLETKENLVSEPHIFVRLKAQILRELGREREAKLLEESAPRLASAIAWFVEGSRWISIGHDEDDEKISERAYAQALQNLRRAVNASNRARRAFHFQLAHAYGHLQTGDSHHVADAMEALWPNDGKTWKWIAYGTRQDDLKRAVSANEKAMTLGSSYSSLQVNLAARLRRAGKVDQSIDLLKSALELEKEGSEHASLHFSLGRSYADAKKYELAVKSMRRGLEIDTENAARWRELGFLFMERRLWGKAAEAYQEAINIDPKDDVAHNNLAYSLGKMGRPEDGIKYAQIAVDLDPKNVKHLINLASLWSESGKDNEHAERLFKEAARLDPGNPHSRYCLGKHFLRQRKYDLALEAGREALALDENDQTHFELMGVIFRNLKRTDLAIEYYEKALKVARRRLIPLLNLGALYCDQKEDFERSLYYFQAALKISPRHAPSLSNIGVVYEKQEKWDLAIKNYEKALGYDERDSRTYIRLGKVYLRTKQYPLAIETYEKAAVAIPNESHKFFRRIGRAHKEAGQWTQAIGAFEKAITAKSDWPTPYNDLAWMLVDPKGAESIRDGVKAIPLAEKAVALTKRMNLNYLDTLAEAHYAAGQLNKAILVAKEGLALAKSKNAAEHVRAFEALLNGYEAAKPLQKD